VNKAPTRAMAEMVHFIEPVIPSLRRYARTFVREPGAADDLVQDTLERAISRWHQRRSDSDARAWLFIGMVGIENQRLALSDLSESCRVRSMMARMIERESASRTHHHLPLIHPRTLTSRCAYGRGSYDRVISHRDCQGSGN
jgi:predicted RNA polymerase sigma factor